jgi:imidazolonepropionase-like amidohydrolase
MTQVPLSVAAALLAVVSCTAATSAPSRTATEQQIVISNVNVIPMTSDTVLRNRTVVMQGGVVVDITERASLPRRGSSTVLIDGRGGYLAPGLMDLHVHLYDPGSLPSYVAHGVTTILDLNGGPHSLQWARSTAAGHVVGPRILSSGPTLDGLPPLNSLFIGLETVEQAHNAVQAQKAAGYDVIKVYGSMSPQLFHTVITGAREARIPVFGHINRGAGASTVLSSGQSVIAHAFEFIPTALNDSTNVARIPDLVRDIARSGVAVIPTLNVNREDLAGSRDPGAPLRSEEAQYAPAAVLSEKLPTTSRSRSPQPAAHLDELLRVGPFERALVRALDSANVPLLLGSDAEVWGFAGQSALMELEELREAGLSAYRALRTATQVPATFLRRAGISSVPDGIVAVGARPDLVLLSANPLVDVGAYRAPRVVVIGGRVIDGKTIAAERVRMVRRRGNLAMVAQLDSLLRTPNADFAIVMLEQWEAITDGPLLAEVVLREHARRLLRQPQTSAPQVSAQRLRQVGVRWYSNSFSAAHELAESHMQRGDSAAALTEFKRALSLMPGNGIAMAWIDRLETARRPVRYDPVGTFVLRLSRPDGSVLRTDTLVLTQGARGYSGIIAGIARSPVHGIIVGDDRMWFSSTGANSADYRLRFDGDALAGQWLMSFGRQGSVSGLRRRNQP